MTASLTDSALLPSEPVRAVVVGLGYVGLPLAVALARAGIDTCGFDTDARRLEELSQGRDRTGEVDGAALAASSLRLIRDRADCPPADFYIVTVPTPIDAARQPDLSAIRAASRTVGAWLPGAVSDGRVPVVVYESTVYPGVTEHECAPILEAASGLACGGDFFLGYSPERINPGDREHGIERITKVVAGQTAAITARIARLYARVTTGGVFAAASIQVAEAAKVIENAQRDINIAFMNEVAAIFARLGLSTADVLAAARTKWNFLPFTPGLVGGHCIGVDPYYLAYKAQAAGIKPRVILAGRDVNDGMADWVAGALHAARGGRAGSALVLGLTFKEDVPDLRNSKVVDLVRALTRLGHAVTVHDPHADVREARREHGLELAEAPFASRYDLVFLAVPHRHYLAMGAALRNLVAPGGMLADLKGALGPAADWRL